MSQIPVIKSDLTVEELAKLADEYIYYDLDVCKQIARHPNTSIETLKKLFRECPKEVLNNCKIDSLANKDDIYLELFNKNPDCFYDFNCSLFPLSFVEWAVNHSDTRVRRELASSQFIKLSILEKLAKDTDDGIRAFVAENKYISDEIVTQLAEDKCLEVIKNIAENPQTNHDILLRFSNHNNKDVRVSLARNKNISLAISKKLIQDKEDEVKAAIANNIKIPHFILEKLFKNTKDIQFKDKILIGIMTNHNASFSLRNKSYQLYKNNFAQFIEADVLDFMVIKVCIDLEMERLNWAKETGRNYILKTYKRKSRLLMSDAQLIEFWQYLISLPGENNYENKGNTIQEG